MVSLSSITLAYGNRVLFRGADLLIRPGDKIALVGPNGSGKISVFRLITGEESPERHEPPAETFSGGWKMRIALAGVLLKNPNVLLYVRFTSMEEGTRSSLMKRGVTVFARSHSLPMQKRVPPDSRGFRR